MPSPKIRKKPTNKRCEKGFPCKTTCISRAKNCRKPLKWQAETFALWLKAQEERLAITNQKRERAGLAPAQLTEHGYITADRTRVSPSENKAAIASPVPGSKTVGKSRKTKGLSDVIKQEVARPPSSLEKEVMAENKAIAAPSPNRPQDKLNAPKKLTLKEFEQLQVNDPVLFSVKRNGVTDYVKGRITKKHESSIYVEYSREGGGVTQRSEPRTNLFRVTSPLEILPEKSIKMMRDAIASVDINKLEEMLHTGNRSWRKMFEQSEGITLPKTIQGTHNAIADWARQRGVQKTSLDNEPKAIEEMPDQWADYIPRAKGLLPKGERGKFGNVNVTIHGNYAYGSDKGKWIIYDTPSRQPIIAVGNKLTAQMATHEMLRVMDGKSYHDLLKSSSLSEDDFYSIYSKKVNEITTATAKPNAKELKAIAKITDTLSQSQTAIAANQGNGYEYLGKTETEHPVGDDGDKIVMEYRLRPTTSDDFYRDSPILMGDKFILEKRRSEIFGGQKREGDWAIAGRGKTKKDALMGVVSSSDFRKMKSEHPDVKMAIDEYDQGRSKANESAKSKQRASEVESARKTLRGHQNHLSLLREKDPQFKTDYGKKERKRIGDSINELFGAYPELASEFAGIKESLKPQRGKVATPSFEQAVVTEVAGKKNSQAKTTSASERADDRLMAILKKKPHEMTEDEFNFARQDVLQRLGSIPLNSGEMVRQQDKIAKETREKLKGLGVETYTGSQYSSQGYAYDHIGLGVYYPRNIPQKVRAQAEKVISDAQAKIKKLDQDRQSQIDALGLPPIAFEIIMPGKLHSNYVFYHNLESKQDAKAKGSAIASPSQMILSEDELSSMVNYAGQSGQLRAILSDPDLVEGMRNTLKGMKENDKRRGEFASAIKIGEAIEKYEAMPNSKEKEQLGDSINQAFAGIDNLLSRKQEREVSELQKTIKQSRTKKRDLANLEPWEMTREEYIALRKIQGSQSSRLDGMTHGNIVARALGEGMDVPSYVKSRYPNVEDHPQYKSAYEERTGQKPPANTNKDKVSSKERKAKMKAFGDVVFGDGPDSFRTQVSESISQAIASNSSQLSDNDIRLAIKKTLDQDPAKANDSLFPIYVADNLLGRTKENSVYMGSFANDIRYLGKDITREKLAQAMTSGAKSSYRASSGISDSDYARLMDDIAKGNLNEGNINGSIPNKRTTTSLLVGENAIREKATSVIKKRLKEEGVNPNSKKYKEAIAKNIDSVAEQIAASLVADAKAYLNDLMLLQKQRQSGMDILTKRANSISRDLNDLKRIGAEQSAIDLVQSALNKVNYEMTQSRLAYQQDIDRVKQFLDNQNKAIAD